MSKNVQQMFAWNDNETTSFFNKSLLMQRHAKDSILIMIAVFKIQSKHLLLWRWIRLKSLKFMSVKTFPKTAQLRSLSPIQ